MAAKKEKTGENTRIFKAFKVPRGAKRVKTPEEKGPKAAHGLRKNLSRANARGRFCIMKAVTIKLQKDDEKRPLTIIVGLNVSKKAVERNKVRRRIRAIMRNKEGKYVIIVHPGATTILFQELKQQIEKQLQ